MRYALAMRHFLPGFLLLLVACPETPKETGDTGGGSVETGAEDSAEHTGEAPADDDDDGFDSTEDCDDHDYSVNPDATETCNGVDDNCDGTTDEGFDRDGDGATNQDACIDGTDCDDSLATVAPGAPEVPYDGIDQDCDGADLIDVDGDRYDYTFDCDDEDAEVHPGATEVAKNGKDDDCEGGDSLDLDGDGHDDEDFGGDDCDDVDASTHPGARDLWNDGLDPDCDGLDSRLAPLADSGVSIVGDSGEQGLVGESVAFCDLDEDGVDDLVVTAPFGGLYAGRVGIFYGSAEASWGPDMAMGDADTLIESSELFLGFGLACADLDGDGHLDLATTRGEIHYSTYDADYEMVLLYGSGTKFAATLDESDLDARLSYPLGVTANIASVFAQGIAAGDVDGDGAAELFVNDATGADMSEPTGRVMVLAGGRYSGSLDLADEAVAEIDGGADGFSRVRVIGDRDGDGAVDLFLGQAGYEPVDTAGSSDTGGAAPSAGRLFLADATLVDAVVADLAWQTSTGRSGDAYGWDLALQDLDADGADDSVVAALGFGTYAGSLYLYAGLPDADGPVAATAEVLGSTAEGYFGFELMPIADVDGDGVDEIFVSELFGGASKEGLVWVISGAAAWAGGGDAESTALLAWSGEEAEAYTGNSLAAGDVNADGVEELAIGAQLFSNGTGTTYGKVYVIR